MTSALRDPAGPAAGDAGAPARVARAVLLATAPAGASGPAAALPYGDGTVLGHLVGALEARGVTAVEVVARGRDGAAAVSAALAGRPVAAVHPAADLPADLRLVRDLLARAHGPVLVAHADVLVSGAPLDELLGGGDGTAALVADGLPARPGAQEARVSGGRVRSAGSPVHTVGRADAAVLGLLRVGEADRDRAAALAGRLAGLAEHPPPAWPGAGDGAPADVPALLTTALVRDGAHVAAASLLWHEWTRPRTAAEAAGHAARLASGDAERRRLRQAVKRVDGTFTTFAISPWSPYLARWCARRGLTPNQVTVASMAVGVAAAAAFATGERWGLVAGAVLVQAAFALDCVDGQLARYTRRFSAFGAWLDGILDRGKEYAVYAGLALGAAAAGDDVWLLACLALALQTVRHGVDFAYPPAGAAPPAPEVAAPPLEEPADGLAPVPAAAAGAPAGPRGRLVRAWRGTDERSALMWLRRTLMLPIGERFAVISLTAALFDARVTFTVLLAWGAVAFAYVAAGRLARAARALRGGPALPLDPDPGRLRALRDDGPVAQAAGRVLAGSVTVAPALAWTLPPLLWALELGGITLLVALAGADALPGAFALLAAAAFRHYDVVYRRRQGSAADARVAAAGLGWDGRLALAAVLVAVSAVPAGLYGAAGALALLFVGDAAHGWRTAARTGARAPLPPDDPEESFE